MKMENFKTHMQIGKKIDTSMKEALSRCLKTLETQYKNKKP